MVEVPTKRIGIRIPSKKLILDEAEWHDKTTEGR